MQPAMILYRLLLPLYVVTALPAWVIKMAQRGGFGTGLRERAGIYREELEFEPAGGVMVHAVSVGEALLALKLIRAWRERDPSVGFVLGVATATGHAVAVDGSPEGVRVVYQPLDFRFLVKRYLDRFEPTQLVLVEGEMWPNLLIECEAREIPVRLVNARMSPRSKARYERLADWVRPVFSKLDAVAVQEPEDTAIWQLLGVSGERVHVTGSLKFDPGSGVIPEQRSAFGQMIDACAGGRPVVIAASTHVGEEIMLGRAVREAGGFYLCVPRHAERREEVSAQLMNEGFEVVLRSSFVAPGNPRASCLVVDSTGELRDWTAHADVVVIGKSFLGFGGQNPAEAIQAGKPLVFGPHMENFQPLVRNLLGKGGALMTADEETLVEGLGAIFAGNHRDMVDAASGVLATHDGAVRRTLDLLVFPQ